VGDGLTDDTAAFARAIASLGTAGGMVYVPGGTYLIDPLQSVRLTSNITLQLASDAVLKAKAVGTTSYSIVLACDVQNVCIAGGTIIGERNAHLGTTGEWGMGVRVIGSSDVRIDGVQILDCWGDGIYVGATAAHGESQRVTISKCIVRNNRRQGISITGCVGALVEDCEVTDTNGIDPESGIDLEPNAMLRVNDVTIRNCIAVRNSGFGILLNGGNVTDVRVESCQLKDNARDGSWVNDASRCTFRNNTVERNSWCGLRLTGANNNQLLSNTFGSNCSGAPSHWFSILLANASSGNLIDRNIFVHGRGRVAGPPDVSLSTSDCVNNTIVPST
jgi:parallel beta-helix repeat protein